MHRMFYIGVSLDFPKDSCCYPNYTRVLVHLYMLKLYSEPKLIHTFISFVLYIDKVAGVSSNLQ